MQIKGGAFTIAFFAGSLLFAAEDRIAGPVEPAKTTILRRQAHRRALPQFDRGPVDPALRIDYATLLLKPAAGLEAFLADQQNPSSANYHRWLTPEQFADRFGLSANDIGSVVGWLESEGLKVNDVARGRHWITFSGTAAQVGAAFHTEIHRYQTGAETHFANTGDLSIPAALEGVVAGVRGLNDFRPAAMHTAPRAVSAPDLTSGDNHYLAPDDLATIYDLAPLYKAGIDGSGQTIAVVGRTDVDLTDIRAFRSRFNLAPNDPQIMLIGPDPGTNSDDLTEADLDLEWSGAAARNATIIYVNSMDVDTSAQYAVDHNLAPVITFSYGLCEEESLETLRSIAQQANAQGITWMVSSGDSAAATCDRSAETPQATKGLAVSYPASIPEITAVGGTEFNEGSGNYWSPTNSANQASALSYIPERVWNDSALRNAILGGGGGGSLFFAKPSWQTGPGVPNDNARDLPDVSLTASADHVGYEVVNNGLVYVLGGTSASSPVFAGIVALLNQSLVANKVQKQPGVGNINPALYRLARATTDVFHDVTTGDNIVPCAQATPNCVNGSFGYTATAGYDLASGLGSVDAFHLVNEWSAGAASVTTLSASPASIAPGDTVQLAATVTAAGAIPSGSVTFVTNDSNLGSVALTNGPSTATASLSVSSAVIAAGNGTVSALYSGDTTFAPSTGSVNVPLKITPSASYVVPAIVPDPIYEVGGIWPFELTLTEKAGVATTITGLTVAGVNELSLLGSNRNLAANGSMTLFLFAQRLTPPTSQTVQFSGLDLGGQAWTQTLVVTYLGPIGPSIGPGITLTGAPSAIQQSPPTDPLCSGWLSHVTVQETGGFAVSLGHFAAGTTNFDSSISQYFGTTRLAPFGSLSANVCLTNLTAPAQKTFTIAGTAEDGAALSASFTATLSSATASTAAFSVSAPRVTIPIADSTQQGNATLDLQFSAGLPQWTATVLPAARSSWLTVSALSGNGPGAITLQASGKGLANGVYNATLSIQAAGFEPQAIEVPVVLVVGASSGVSVMGVGNAASGGQVFAPGQLLAVYGNNLANATVSAPIQPLPLTLAGTSATVNGVSAPLWFVSPGQMNIQIPYETGAGPAVLGINNNGKVASFIFQAAPAGPGIFAYQGAMVPIPSATQGQTILGFITGDGDVTPTLASGATPPAGTALSAFPQSRLPLTMTIGGEPANIVFHGIVTGLIGVTQINFTVPIDAKTGVQPVVVSAGGVSSAPVNLTVLPASGTN